MPSSPGLLLDPGTRLVSIARVPLPPVPNIRSYDTYNYYDDYYYEEFEVLNESECTEDNQFTGEACDVVVKGGDKIIDKYKGGVDGTYKAVGCREGKPYYKREGSGGECGAGARLPPPKGTGRPSLGRFPLAERYLYYTADAGAWDFSSTLNTEGDQHVPVYSEGEFGFVSDRPQLVAPGMWFLATEHMTKPKDASAAYEARNEFTVSCVEGQKDSIGTMVGQGTPPLEGSGVVAAPHRPPSLPPAQFKDVHNEEFMAGPLLTDAEMESQLKEVYRNNSHSGIGFKVVTFLMLAAVAMFGASLTLGVPCLLYLKKINATRGLAEYVEHQRKAAAGRLD